MELARNRQQTSAFSLVELSIVLVILGLLVGGILAGQSLIRASELRQVSVDYQRYLTATLTFRDKFFSLPGDFAIATKVWGAADGGDGIGADCRIEQTSLATCNGGGDNLVVNNQDGIWTYETHLFWKHLANAGLIEGNYTGTISQATGQCVNASGIGIAGCNVPATRVSSSAMWVIHNGGAKSADTYVFDGFYGNALVLQNWSSVFGAGSDTRLKPEELWNIDTKIDDGNPATGKLVGSRWNNSCATGASTSADFANARYNLTTTTLYCAAIFRNLF